jgi:hypothetical protein
MKNFEFLYKAICVLFFGFIIGITMGVSSCSQIPIDKSVSAAQGNDPSVGLFGCGDDKVRNYVFCRLRENGNQSDEVTFVVPGVTCKRDNCVQIQIIKPDGSFGLTQGLAKGQTQIALPISDITQSNSSVTKAIDGEYRVLVRVYFTGPDGTEYQNVMIGFIRINVLSAAYIPMGCNDPMVAFETTISRKDVCKIQWSTALRSAICGKGCEG